MTQKPGLLPVGDLIQPVQSDTTTHGLLASLNSYSQATQTAETGLAGLLRQSTKEAILPWMYVAQRFTAFQANLLITDRQRDDAETKFKGLASTLNAAYRGHNSDSENAFRIGSWAKDTHIRPPRDLDMYYVLPIEVYQRFEGYSAGVNKQSALLQEVKNKLLITYPNSVIRGDGPVVLADFHGWTVEIVPAFNWDTKEPSYVVCDTKNGGNYIKTMPWHEVVAIENAEKRANNNVRPLIRMLKCWQTNCNVPIRSFYLELLAIEFLDSWGYKDKSVYYYDWMCRDFFTWFISRANGFLLAPGTSQVMALGDSWKSRAETAATRATKAELLERDSKMLEAGDEWQKIFGTDIPRYL